MLRKYLQPQRYVRRLQALTASFSKPITDYEAETLTEFVYQKTVAFNRITSLDLGMRSEHMLLAVSIALEEKLPGTPCRVLDFGGACGVHCKLVNLLFPDVEVKWAVVETASMLRRARALETNSLKFFEDIDSAVAWLEGVDLLNSNSVLQYLQNPLLTTQQLLELSPKVVLWGRLMLAKGPTFVDRQRTMLFNHGPGEVVPTGFRNRPILNKVTKLSRDDFLSAHQARYRLRCEAEEHGFSTYLFSRR